MLASAKARPVSLVTTGRSCAFSRPPKAATSCPSSEGVFYARIELTGGHTNLRSSPGWPLQRRKASTGGIEEHCFLRRQIPRLAEPSHSC